LKQICYIFVYLNIYTSFNLLVYSQDITLSISSEITISESLNESLKYTQYHQDFNSVKREAEKISKTLAQIGYIENKLLRLEKTTDSTCNAHFYFGTKYPLIKIYYNQTTFTKKQIAHVSNDIQENYFTISTQDCKRALLYLNQIQTKDGNTFGKLKLTNLKVKNATISATLETSSKTKRRIDSITIRGYKKFPKAFITHYAGIKKGTVFDKQTVLKKNNALNALGFARSIKPPEALFEKEKTTVYLYLEKRNFNTFDGIIGFATDEKTGNITFNGYLDLVLNNNLNFGEQLIIKYKADGADQQNLTLRTELPYLFQTPLGIEAELNIFKRDSTFSSTSQVIQGSYQISPTSKGHIGYRGNTSTDLLSAEVNPERIQDFEARYFTTGVQIVKPQNSRLFPVKTRIKLSIAHGKRKTSTTKKKQTSISNTVHHNMQLNKNNMVYLQNTTSLLISDDYVTNELFRFGGINSIRGFAENSIDASLLSVLNTEYRYLINNSTYIHTIIDLGYFENEVIRQKEKLYSFGIGLGVSTKAGLLKFNLANGNIENQAFKFSNSKIHLSLTSQF
jgi:hypothetical protein